MAGLIPQGFVADLLGRVDIVEVIDRRVRLKKAGRNYVACCPFHDEKTPSFNVSQERQFYHCFGCGVGGDALAFIMAYEKLPFPDAVESLAQFAGVEVPREKVDAQTQQVARSQQDLCALLEQAAHFYRRQLAEHPDAGKARDYLQRRGLTEAVIEQFGIGYAPPGWDNLQQHLLPSGWKEQQLLDSGMLVEREDKSRRYDRFRDRIMFPIRDVRGRVIAFGGRVLGDEKPKYLNSPETPVFSKSRELYGLYEANRSKSGAQRLVVVEGYMDVVALAQFGLTAAVATLGTAAGTAHLDKAFRYCNEVVFCFDGDEAGRKAAARALEVSLPALREQRRVGFLFLADGEDPDSYVRKRGLDAFVAQLDKAQPLSAYFFEQHAQGLSLASAEGRAALVSRALPLLARVPEGVFRQQMLMDLALRTQTDRYALESMLDAAASGGRAGSRDSAPAAPEAVVSDATVGADRQEEPPAVVARSAETSSLDLPPLDAALHILLCYPRLAASCMGLLPRLKAGLPDVDLEILISLLELAGEHPQASMSRLLGLWQGRYGEDPALSAGRLYALAGRENLYRGEEQAAAHLQDLLRLLLVRIEQESPLEQLIARSRTAELTEWEKQELRRLLLERR